MFDKLIDVFLQFAELFRIYTIVAEFEEAVVLRFGRYNRTLGPGLHFMWPFLFEDYISTNVVYKTGRSANQVLTAKDGTTIVLSITIGYTVKNTRKYLLDVDDPKDVFTDMVTGAAAALVKESTWQEITSADFDEKLYELTRKRGFRFGVELEYLKITDVSKTKNITLTNN